MRRWQRRRLISSAGTMPSHRRPFHLSRERRRWWQHAMRPHRLDRAAWEMISEFESRLDQQMKTLRALLLREFGKLPRHTRSRSPK